MRKLKEWLIAALVIFLIAHLGFFAVSLYAVLSQNQVIVAYDVSKHSWNSDATVVQKIQANQTYACGPYQIQLPLGFEQKNEQKAQSSIVLPDKTIFVCSEAWSRTAMEKTPQFDWLQRLYFSDWLRVQDDFDFYRLLLLSAEKHVSLFQSIGKNLNAALTLMNKAIFFKNRFPVYQFQKDALQGFVAVDSDQNMATILFSDAKQARRWMIIVGRGSREVKLNDLVNLVLTTIKENSQS